MAFYINQLMYLTFGVSKFQLYHLQQIAYKEGGNNNRFILENMLKLNRHQIEQPCPNTVATQTVVSTSV